MLDRIKKEGVYEGIEYNHRGPAHLSIGQEAAAVGPGLPPDARRLHLRLAPQPRRDPGQEPLGHRQARRRGAARDHGELPGRRSAAGRRDASRGGTRQGPGHRLRRSTARWPRSSAAPPASTRAWAARCTPSSRPSASCPTTPSSAARPTSPSARRSSSASTASRASSSPTSATPRWAAARSGKRMMFAAMDQYRTLWAGGCRRRAADPLQLHEQLLRHGRPARRRDHGLRQSLARVGLGVNPEAMHAERVDGYNPLAVADAIAAQAPDPGGGPRAGAAGHGHLPLLRPLALRRLGLPHQGRDGAVAAAGLAGRLPRLPAGQRPRRRKRSWPTWRPTSLAAAAGRSIKAAVSLDVSPRIDAARRAHRRGDVLQPARRSAWPTASRTCCCPKQETRFKADVRPSSALAWTRTASRGPRSSCLTYAEALFEAMIHRFYEDPTMVAYGEENRDWGGAFGVYRGLTEALPYHRLFNSPISEGAIVGTAVGYALSRRPRGGRADVLRLHGPRRRRDLQPDGQVAGHVGRRPADAAGAAGLRRRQVRRAALAGLDLARAPTSPA